MSEIYKTMKMELDYAVARYTEAESRIAKLEEMLKVARDVIDEARAYFQLQDNTDWNDYLSSKLKELERV